MNLREGCSAHLAGLEHELADLHPNDLGGEELLTYAREGAAHVERFLKQLTIKPSSDKLFAYIDELRALGLPTHNADALHAIRKASNAGKHDASATVDLNETQKLLRDARDAIDVVGISGVAWGADAPEPALSTRTYAVIVADYPTHGEVEYDICTLLDDGSTVILDGFQLQYRDEEAVLAELRASGQLDIHPTTGPVVLTRAALAGSTELSGIWLYHGDLRRIVDAFAPLQHSEALPELQRRNDTAAIRTAIAIAVVDGGAAKLSAEQITAELRDRFAISGDHIDWYAAQAASLVATAGANSLDGPRLVSPKRYELAAARALARDDDLRMAVAVDGVLFVDVGPGYVPMP
jgi:hypothetical protein